MRRLGSLGNQLRVTLPSDESGYVGRECPNAECRGYFKIVPGTGLSGVTDCHCPYCGHTADHSEFHTAHQIQYAKSVAMREVTGATIKYLKGMEFDIKPKGPFGIGLSMKVRPGPPHPVHWYKENALETHIQCSSCTLKYAVFGVFAFCPDCRQHNSLQILDKNLEMVVKMLQVASGADAELAGRLVENALEDCVSAFDGFGRETCRLHAKASGNAGPTEHVSFQNLEGAKQNMRRHFGLDLTAGLTDNEWKAAILGFQKRHLLSHKMGVVDAEYVRKSGDTQAVVGHKINVDAEEVRELGLIIGKLGRYLSDAMGAIGS